MLHFLSNKTIYTSHHILMSKILGSWIIQSTFYSFTKKQVKNLTGKVQWSYIENQHKNLDIILKNNCNNIQLQDFTIYIFEKKNDNVCDIIYEFFLFNNKIKYGYILTFNNDFNVLKKYTILCYSNNHIDIFYKNKNNINIFQKIYFLNNNLKINKYIMKKNNRYYNLCFSSEIKLS